MKVVLATHGRFHSFDLARELHRHGVYAGIWTPYPRFKLKNEGLPPETVHTDPSLTFVRRAFDRARAPKRLIDELEWQRSLALDRRVRTQMPKDADTLVALSMSGLNAGRALQARGGVWVCDRGSTHCVYQQEIQEEEYARYGLTFPPAFPRAVERELSEYAEADAILVPTAFVAQTFVDQGIPEHKLKRALYGVNLDQFYPTGTPPTDTFEVLFVGALSIRKGLRYLLEAFERFGHPSKRLTLVGAPQAETADLVAKAIAKGNVVATGILSREEVRERMSRSHVLVLPSVEDGMGMVQTQAMACGSPVIATKNTGCEEIFLDGKEGFAVPMRDPDAILDRLTQLADVPGLRDAMGRAAQERVKRLGGWSSYGDAVYGHLQALMAAKGR